MHYVNDVRKLLEESFDQIEQLWAADPSLINACAATVKQFMQDRDIGGVGEGMAAYIAFKEDQSASLAELGLRAQSSPRAPSSLAQQVA